MAAITESITQLKNSVGRHFNWTYFLQDNLTGSAGLTVWVILLALITISYTVKQVVVAPLSTTLILLVVGIGISLVIASSLFRRHTKVGDWLKVNLINSISNVLLTLLILLLLASAARGVWQYAVVNASFDPAETTPDLRPQDGGTWGVLAASSDDPNVQGGARDLLYYGRLDRQFVPRVQTAVAILLVLALVSFIANKTGYWQRSKPLQQTITYLWLLSPIIIFILLAGVGYEAPLINTKTLLLGEGIVVGLYLLSWWQRVVKYSLIGLISAIATWPVVYVIWRLIGQSEAFPPINVDTWGGLMFTLILATSVILLSFPLGMFLALGRRSEIRGIPNWITWPVAIVLAIWGFQTTPQLLADARNTFETVVAFWPVLILLATFALQRSFKGNVVAAATTAFIEVVRGVPLITILFMAIIMAPFFFAEGSTPPKNPYSVIVGYTVFASAYMAELIRGGLQAIPKGQFEAADALGLNTLQKMRFIVLPQALRILIPALVGSFIGNFKSSSLVAVVGLFDLVGIVGAIIGNPQWLGLRKDLYFVLAVFYFVVSFTMSSYSRRLETKLGVGQF
jgi:ABC-type amino acid transport system permease subunit